MSWYTVKVRAATVAVYDIEVDASDAEDAIAKARREVEEEEILPDATETESVIISNIISASETY